MRPKVIRDNTIPSTWKRVATSEHKYLVSQRQNTKNIISEVYHCDDCTLNNLDYLFEVKGGINKVISAIDHYEFEQTQIEADNKKINEFIGL